MRSMGLWLLTAGAAMAAPSPQVAPPAVSPQVVAQADAVHEPAAPEEAELQATSALSIGGYAIQPPGQFHGGETIALDGETWLALRVDADDAALLPAVLRVSVTEDPLVDAPGERTGASVTSTPQDDAIRMFLRGPALVAGMVDQARVDMTDGDGRHRFERALAFRDARYRLRSECTPRDAAPVAGQLLFDCRIVLRDRMAANRCWCAWTATPTRPGEAAWLGDDAAPALLFAGDLDRDGELDLLFDTSHHYNLSRPTLFLSSQARAGELLREVAAHEATGC